MAYVKCDHLDFTSVLKALDPLVAKTGTEIGAGPANRPKVTISNWDYGTLFFESSLRSDIRQPIDINYVECGEGCEHHPYELPQEGDAPHFESDDLYC